MPKLSTMTEWSMTRSTGTSGLILAASAPSLAMASRIAARSTTAGTPVKSCIRTRAGRKAISCSTEPLFSIQAATALQVGLGDGHAVLVAQQVLEQHLHRARQAGNPGQTGFLGGRKAVIGVFLAPDGEIADGWKGCRLTAWERSSGQSRPDIRLRRLAVYARGAQVPGARGEQPAAASAHIAVVAGCVHVSTSAVGTLRTGRKMKGLRGVIHDPVRHRPDADARRADAVP